MKIAYLSSPSFSDVDISMLCELQYKADIDYYLLTYPAELRSAAINIQNPILKDGVLEAASIPDLGKVTMFLNKVSFFVVNSKKNRVLSKSRVASSLMLFYRIWRGKYDVVHSTAVPGITTLWLWVFRKKLVLTIHDPIPHSSHKIRSQRIERWFAMKFCKNFILLNKGQEEEFINFYKINLKKQNIYHSRLSSYNYLRMYADAKPIVKQDYILFFGKIYSYKGLQHLFPAMQKVHEAYPDLKLVVAGKGTYPFDIAPYKDLPYFDIRNRFIPDDELSSLIKYCKFVVVPYIDATQSGVVMSAFAFYKPCIVTNVGGLPEMVVHNSFGYVIEPANEEQLSQTICNLYKNKETCASFSENIKKEYEGGKSSWRNIVDGMVAIYKQLV